MDINAAIKYWNEIGKRDPLWAVLNHPGTKGNRWDVEKFFGIGRDEIDQLMQYIASLKVPLARRRAFDFGCGVGRLTQALAGHFENVDGVDISQSMIEAARRFNRYGDRVKYQVNEKDDLGQFPDGSFDLIYTNITLQHIAPVHTEKYLKEFVRILAPKGLMIFQLPAEPARTWRGLLYRYAPMKLLNMARRMFIGAVIEMHGIKRDRVVALLQEQRARILDIQENQAARRHWISYQYCATKD